MIIDGFQLFTGQSNGASGGISNVGYTDSPTTGTQAASNIIDYGIVSGIPASAVGGGGARDMGIGDDPALKVQAIVTTAFTSGTSLAIRISGAPDAGSNTPGSYSILWTGPAILEAQLVVGARIANIDVPRWLPNIGPIRYYQMNFVTVGTHVTGAVEGFIGLDADMQLMSSASGQGGTYSGYPAGINVAN